MANCTDVPEFTNLEEAALAAICDLYPQIGDEIRNLVATARSVERDNTGHGFFTSFEIDRTNSAITWPYRFVDGPTCEIQVGDQVLIMGFILWLEAGFPNCLEGFQFGTKSGGEIDLKQEDLASLVFLSPVL